MEIKESIKKGFGLFRNFGWKKNLLAFAAGFLLCILLELATNWLSGFRLISAFDMSVAVMPLIGFVLGIWGIIGCLVAYFGSLEIVAMSYGFSEVISQGLLISSTISLAIYCALPSMLWYALPLKGEKRTNWPKLDTCAHVVKYYLIMIVTVGIFVTVNSFEGFKLSRDALNRWPVLFTQYLDVVLIVGIPLLILISMIRNRTITINERMVLGFLTIGVAASALGAYLVYRNTLFLEPSLFEEYDQIFSSQEVLDSARFEAIFERYNAFWDWYSVIIAVMLNILLIIEMILMRSIEKKVTRPILHLSKVLEEYTASEEGGLNSGTVKTECGPYQTGYGEVSSLTRTCVNMVGEIDNYTRNLQTVTAEKERIGTELDVASKIQKDMLPSIFPPFPDRTEISLFADMTPAREVGGDFYDFYFIDHDHLALTIADVSGKGVPASLFMVISKTLLKNHALTGGSPKEILAYVNHQLCENNTSFMFCTVWLGILDLTNGRLISACAGHEYPAIKRNGGKYELIVDRHDPPLGLRDGMRFHDYELTLQPGDCLFEYTDGVTEATSDSEELFGEERMIQALNADPDASPQAQIERVYEAIQAFVKEAPQFDDITMLGIQYLGCAAVEESTGNKAMITVPASDASLDAVTAFAEEHLEAVGCDPAVSFQITVAVEEIFVNIAHYAYDGREGEAEIGFSFDEKTGMIEMTFSDSGIPFDPTSMASPDITLKPSKRKVGGLGIHIVKKTMDEVIYDYPGGKNLLTIRKHI